MLPVLALAQNGPAGKIVDARGGVEVFAMPQQAWEAARTGQELTAGQAIRTGSDGWAALLLADETLIQLNDNTLFVLKEVAATAGWQEKVKFSPAAAKASPSSYEIKTGQFWLRNENPNRNITITTPTLSAGVRGTEMDVRVAQDGVVYMSILDGQVRAYNNYGEVMAGSLEQIVGKPGAAPFKQVLLSPADAVQWTLSIPELLDFIDIRLFGGAPNTATAERERLRSLIADSACPAENLLVYGQIMHDLGQSKEAVKAFERVLKQTPNNSTALNGLGWALLRERQPRAALECFTRVASPSPLTYLGLSAAYEHVGQLERAHNSLRLGKHRYPHYSPFLIQEAFLQLASRKPEKAEELLKRATETAPETTPAWSVLSLLSLVKGDKAAALIQATNGVKFAPDSAVSYIVLSYAHQAHFDMKQALAASELALKENENNILALVNRAQLLFGADYPDEAWDIIQKAWDMAPRSALVNNLRGYLLLARRQTQEAIFSFELASKLAPGLGEPHLGRALALMRQGDDKQAVEAISTAVLLEPRRSLFVSYWAKMLYQLKRFDQALRMLELARQLDPQDPTPLLYQALILRDLNRPTEAIKALNKSIALNDNRAVYRSRFLLDRDLAVRNMDLALLYKQLGMPSWATAKATASLKKDYTNYSAHYFLASSLLESGERTIAGGSEELLSFIMKPANVNTFNSFNEYTSFFESPSLEGSLEFIGGNHDVAGGAVSLHGAAPSANMAYSLRATTSRSSGFDDSYKERNRDQYYTGQIKYDLTPNDNLSVRYQRSAGTGKTFASDLDMSSEGIVDVVGVGYHRRLSPNSDFVFYFENKFNFETNIGMHFAIPISDIYYFEDYLSMRRKTPYIKGQAQYFQRIGDHQFIFGLDQLQGKDMADTANTLSFMRQGFKDPLASSTRNVKYNLERSYQSYYVQDSWSVTNWLTVEAALYYEKLTNTNSYIDKTWSLSELNPRGGLIFNLTDSDTLRVAAFKYLEPFWAPRIDPYDIAGVPVYSNLSPGSVAKEADLVWEHEWSSGFFTSRLFYLDSAYKTVDSSDEEVVYASTYQGLETKVNQLLFSGLGAYGAFSAIKTRDEYVSQNDRTDYEASAGLTYVHPWGVSASIIQRFRHEDFKSNLLNDEDIFLTDLKFSYEFPGKRGKATLQVNNIFNNKFNWVNGQLAFYQPIPARSIFGYLALYF